MSKVNNTPKVSVLIPCYNAERWVEDAVNSISRQSHSNLEVIIFDDGSADQSRQIIKRLATKDARIRLLESDTNVGIVEALNCLVSEASGEYIARMDADDVSTTNRLEVQLAYLTSNKLDLCGSWIKEFGMGPARVTKLPFMPSTVHAHLLFQSPFSHPTVIGRSEVFRAFPYRAEYQYAEDYDVFARASSVYRLGNVPTPLLRYRRTPGQITNSRRRTMQSVSNLIRLKLLSDRGIEFTEQEAIHHNLIRSFESYSSIHTLDVIEAWLLKLGDLHCDNLSACKLISAQWARACVRASAQGISAWNRYRNSRLLRRYSASKLESIDIFLLSLLRLRRESAPFEFFRRVGLSV